MYFYIMHEGGIAPPKGGAGSPILPTGGYKASPCVPATP